MILTPAALPWPRDETHPRMIAGRAVGPRGAAILSGFVDAARLPAITVPRRPSADGLSIGVRPVAPWGGDEDLVALAGACEATHPSPMSWAMSRGGAA